ncbi:MULTISPECIES: hypothetical protein [unclassified Mesorhizobium]|uniref:hypothetical protein n=1 Tax=unclassified Mesorhizobium TaxID=325217 RepID=UPI0015EEEABF|nr:MULTISPECIES: hypothetical protein [unclassified Mesorhizobium]MBZ9683611.1 hypothetical protein [Mesorhizobium sp. CO1-1-2]MBZ9696491.1 hypothetical protein [Mesorhizobium sp. CO1-1-9]MBZ9725517.1 hypothetical protein [Mesorhizobium sp. CO1-1-11]MBZ9923548.1 hypothetical protein [Mesorhizobium sp. BR1-1-4]
MEAKAGYSIAYQAEVEAVTAALKIQDRLPRTLANSLFGVVSKLEIIVAADSDIDGPTDFPWPHIEWILHALKATPEVCRLSGRTDPSCRRIVGDIKQSPPIWSD